MSAISSKRNIIIVSIAAIAVILLGIFTPLLRLIFGLLIPLTAILVFIGGIIYRVVQWAKSPEPFRITTTCGQQHSLPWIKSNRLDNPHSTWAVIGRMALEVLFFRSLFRNTKAELKSGPNLVYGSTKYLWLGALAFHWCFLVIVLRHLRFFTDPTPSFVLWLESLDGFFQIGVPILYMTDIVILAALGFLLFRRLMDAKLRYISLPADYAPLLLILAIVATGVLMRYTSAKPDIVGVKELMMGMASFHPALPSGIGWMFYLHLLLVSMLIAYFPFSKLMHMAGVFLSPTRNLANTNRVIRHINPWDYPVKVHTYQEWEHEFRDKLKSSGYELDDKS
ncbi:MAG: sulfate reduction electron transfer complex DsrMKJOP subunit DsrM [Candidatus Omnitrophica bacterium]|nr:sulfate reduction electron transfer complex DsrMKJOP subunit DsrM [Candidatus Omnitrophota bacterium]